MQEEGYIAKLLYPAGTKDIPLGTPIAIVVDHKEDVAKFKDYKPESQSSPAQESKPEGKPKESQKTESQK